MLVLDSPTSPECVQQFARLVSVSLYTVDKVCLPRTMCTPLTHIVCRSLGEQYQGLSLKTHEHTYSQMTSGCNYECSSRQMHRCHINCRVFKSSYGVLESAMPNSLYSSQCKGRSPDSKYKAGMPVGQTYTKPDVFKSTWPIIRSCETVSKIPRGRMDII